MTDAVRRREFKAGVSAAAARVRKSIEKRRGDRVMFSGFPAQRAWISLTRYGMSSARAVRTIETR